jgi:hypothetical protein
MRLACTHRPPARPLLTALLVTALLATTGCSTLLRLVPHRKKPASHPVTAPQDVGRVALVNASLGFVLIETRSMYTPPPGQALKTFRNGQETGVLAVTAERNHPFVAADIVRGAPAIGDQVAQ